MTLQISATNLSAGYRGEAVIREFDIAIHQGEFWGIVGPNGSGKTTLAKTLAGAIPPLDGKVYRPSSLTFGYVPQEKMLDDIFPVTVLEVVLMGRIVKIGVGKRVTRSDRDQALRCMEQVGIEELAHSLFRQLSGGQKQRVLIARALAVDADVMIFDEAASGMDLAGEAEMVRLICDLHRSSKRTILMITHDLNIIANHAQKLIILHGGEYSRHETGDVTELLTEEKIRQIYRQNIHIQSVDERICIFIDNNKPGGYQQK